MSYHEICHESRCLIISYNLQENDDGLSTKRVERLTFFKNKKNFLTKKREN